MAFTGFDRSATSGAPKPYRIVVEIDIFGTGDTWIDINRPNQDVGYPGERGLPADPWVNRLVGSPQLTQKSEVRPGRFATSISAITVRDNDGQLGQALPWTFYPETSPGGWSPRDMKVWYRRKLRIGIRYHNSGTSSNSIDYLGTFLIDDIQRDPPTRTARVTLVGLEQILMDTKALDVRRGDAWLTNVRLPSLVEELVIRGARGKIELADGFPADCMITSTSVRSVSPLGNLPVKDPAGNWNEKRDFCVRYMFPGISGNESVLYFCGYSISQNMPMVARWDRATDEWISTIRNHVLLGGFEYVFGAQDRISGKLALVATSNQTKSNIPGANYLFRVLPDRKDPDSLDSDTGLLFAAEVYMPQCIMHIGVDQPSFPDLPRHWGTWTGIGTPSDVDAIAVPFDSVPFNPAADFGWTGGCGWSSFDDDSASDAIRTSVDVRSEHNINTLHAYDDKFANHLSGGYAHARMDAPRPTVHHPIMTWSMTGAHEAFRYDFVRGELVYVHNTSSETSGQWRMSKWDIGNNTHTQVDINFGTGHDGTPESFTSENVTAFDLRSTSASWGKVWIATEHNFTVDNNPNAAYIYEFNYGSGTLSSPTRISDNFPTDHDLTYFIDNRQAATIRSIRHNPSIGSGYPLTGCCFNRYAATGHCYGLWKYDGADNDFSGVFGTPNEGQFPISTMPFEVSTVREHIDLPTGLHRFVQDQSNGQIWDFRTVQLVNSEIVLVSFGDPIDSENTWASSNILWDEYVINGEAGRLYGCSASGPPADTQEAVKVSTEWPTDEKPQLGTNTPIGRLTLWQYSFNVSDIIPVADFGGSNIWDALEMCRQLCGDFIMGIDQDGDFFFKARPVSGVDAVLRERGNEFATPGSDVYCDMLRGTLDHKNIINSVTLPAWLGVREPPTAEIVLVPRNRKTSTDNSVSLAAAQTSNNAQRIVLDCLRSGYVVPGETGFDNASEPLLFSWRTVLPDIQTSTSVAHFSTRTHITIFGLREGVDGQAILGNVELHGADPVSGEEGDFVQVEGGNIVTIFDFDLSSRRVNLTGRIGPGAPNGPTVYPIGSAVRITPRNSSIYSSSTAGICHVTTEFVIPAGTIRTLTVNSTSQLAPGILLYRDTGYVIVLKVLTATQASVRGLQLGSGKGMVDTWPVGTILKGAVLFEIQHRAQAIGGTGVSISIASPAFNIKKSGLFIPGDKIIINCEGFISKKITHGMTRSVNDLSISRYDRKEWKPQVENRLMTPARGRMYLESIDTWADPHWMFTATTCPLLTSTDIGTLYTVSHDWLLIGETSNQVNAAVTGITRNLDSSTMALTLRGISAATRAVTTTEELRAPARWKRWRASRWKLGRF